MAGSFDVLLAAARHARAFPSTGDARLDALLSQAAPSSARSAGPGSAPGPSASPEGPGDDVERARLRALVELAVGGDADAFGHLYDHYVGPVFRFVSYRTGSRALAEDLTSETFTRALRALPRFRWEGKDFGAWLTTIARNLLADHYKSSRTRLELVADEVPETHDAAPGPEDEVLTSISHAALMDAVRRLPDEQRDCLLMRFVEGMSIAATAEALGRTEGAIKQLQLRSVRRLARDLPPEAVL